MAAIFDEVTLTWDGEEYTVTPTYRMIQHIEQTVSIAGMANRIASGDPPMSHITFVIAYLLRSAGAKGVNPEDVYEHVMSTMDPDEVHEMATVVMTAFVPKKSQPAKKGKASGGKKPRT